ncbi:MAG: phosphonate C-P lyase system protein PhnG [Oscillochloris sp.]|nr:phosphonate C-P lyase system protein PhnG [Oscillochloris sp.]
MTTETFDQAAALGILCRAPAAAVKMQAERLLAHNHDVQVLRNRTGLMMLPMRESVAESDFYLGEVLVAEAHVRMHGHEGYAVCLGRDLEQALAIAIIDAVRCGAGDTTIEAFLVEQAQSLAAEDDVLLQAVAKTRVELETF